MADGERAAIGRVDAPVTVDSLVADLRDLGLGAGETVLAHTSLSALGWVCGGPPAVIGALRRVLTPSGTLVMPTHSPQYSDPSGWSNPPVPAEWYGPIRESMPPYRPAVTPTRGVGAVPECFRAYPDVVRGEHPVVSFAGWGADAEAVVTGHGLDYGLGEGSPLARLYDRDAAVLLLGVGHGPNTSLHLAEYRAELDREPVTTSAPVCRDGERVRVEYEELETDTGDFPDAGAAFEDARPGAVTVGSVGAATARLVDQPALVDFAVGWFEANR